MGQHLYGSEAACKESVTHVKSTGGSEDFADLQQQNPGRRPRRQGLPGAHWCPLDSALFCRPPRRLREGKPALQHECHSQQVSLVVKAVMAAGAVPKPLLALAGYTMPLLGIHTQLRLSS